MDWYYSDDNQRRGPVSEVDLAELNRTGKINRDTLVWRDGWTDWRKLAEANVPTIVVDGPASQATCAECGKVFPTSEMIQYQGSWVCGTCKPIFFQKVREGVSTSHDLTYAGFWIRFVAKIVDGIILQIVNVPLQIMISNLSKDPAMQTTLGLSAIGLSMVINAAYITFFLGKFGATPGKLALRLRVVSPSGGRISYGRAFCRFLAEFLSSILLCIGYIMAAFDDEKRALHDRICDTRVIRLNA